MECPSIGEATNSQRAQQAVAEIYALSEAVRDMNLRLWIAEEMRIQIEWPGRIFVDNAAGVSFQHGTNPNSQLKGIFDLREQWVKELSKN